MDSDSEKTVVENNEQLADEVKETLEDELNMSEEFAQNQAEQIRLDVKPNAEPETTSMLNFQNVNLDSLLYSMGEITDINIDDETIQMILVYNNTKFETTLERNSQAVANLMEYNNSETFIELIGGKIVVAKVNKHQYKAFIPKNVSTIGKSRYKLDGLNVKSYIAIQIFFKKYRRIMLIVLAILSNYAIYAGLKNLTILFTTVFVVVVGYQLVIALLHKIFHILSGSNYEQDMSKYTE